MRTPVESQPRAVEGGQVVHKRPHIIDNVNTRTEFLALARAYGNVVMHPNGNPIQVLNVVKPEQAKSNSLSSRFGDGAFPFHTDTAFWKVPAKYILLRFEEGDTNRGTLLAAFGDILGALPKSVINNASWICADGRRSLYTTINFKSSGEHGFKFDPCCMKPANANSRILSKAIAEIHPATITRIDWKVARVVVIPNWLFLHARETSNSINKLRVLNRILVN